MHLQYLYFFDCCIDVDTCIYSICTFLIVVLMLTHAFTTLLVLFYCHVDIDVYIYSTCAFLIDKWMLVMHSAMNW